MNKIHRYRSLLLTILILCFSLGSVTSSLAQDDSNFIQFSGRVEALQGSIITVAGLDVDISNTTINISDLQAGMTLNISGNLEGDVVVANTIIIIVNPVVLATEEPSDEATPEVTADPEMTPEVTIEPEVTPVVEATPEPTPDPDAPTIIVIEGPVQEITVNTIVIFDIDIHVDPTDAILTQIQIGDTIRVEGETNFIGGVINIVAVNITIVDINIYYVDAPGVYAPVYVLPANCRIKKSGKITCRGS